MSVASSRYGFPHRLFWFAALLGVEWIPISALVHSQRGGASLARFLIAFASFFLILAYPLVRVSLDRWCAELAVERFGWGWFSAHVCALLAFLALSVSAPEQSGTPLWTAAPLSSIAWLVSGIGAIVLLSFAFIPPVTAWSVLRSTGYTWMYAVAGGAAAWGLVGFSWSLWNTPRGWMLTGTTFDFVHILLRFVVPGVVADRARLMIGTHRFEVEIGDACSGFEGLGMMLVFGVLWLWFFRREIRFPQALLLLPCGLLLMWVLNAARIVALILIGHAGAERIAMGGFHSQAGWISFSAVTLGYAAALQRWHWFSKASSRPLAEARPERNPTTAFLLPFCAILAASLLAHAASADFEWLYPVRFAAAGGALWFLRRHYAALDWSLSWTGPAIGAGAFLLWIGLERVLNPVPVSGMPAALVGASATLRVGWVAIRVLAAVVTVPVAEELAFRGFLLRRVIAEEFETVAFTRVTWAAILISSAAFGALHGSRWIAGTLAGLLYALALRRRGKFGDAVVAHATTNAILAGYVLASGQWQLW